MLSSQVGSSGPGPSTQAINKSLSEIPIHDITASTQDHDEHRPDLPLPPGRVIANDEGYFTAMDAVISGSNTQLVSALSTGIQPDGIFLNGTTLLNEAAAQGRSQLVQTLLRHGADVNAKDANPYGPCRPLYWAARYCRIEVMRMLLRAGAKPQVSAKRMESALTAVLQGVQDIEERHCEALDVLLLEAKVDINLRKGGPTGETLLEQAIQFRHHDMVESLLKRGASPDKTLQTAVLYARAQMTRLLLSHGARDEEGDPALLLAISMRKVGCLRELLKYVSRPYSSELKERVNAVTGAGLGRIAKVLRSHDFVIDQARDTSQVSAGIETPLKTEERLATRRRGYVLRSENMQTISTEQSTDPTPFPRKRKRRKESESNEGFLDYTVPTFANHTNDQHEDSWIDTIKQEPNHTETNFSFTPPKLPTANSFHSETHQSTTSRSFLNRPEIYSNRPPSSDSSVSIASTVSTLAFSSEDEGNDDDAGLKNDKIDKKCANSTGSHSEHRERAFIKVEAQRPSTSYDPGFWDNAPLSQLENAAMAELRRRAVGTLQNQETPVLKRSNENAKIIYKNERA